MYKKLHKMAFHVIGLPNFSAKLKKDCSELELCTEEKF